MSPAIRRMDAEQYSSSPLDCESQERVGSDSFRIFAHLACCAKAIRRLEVALITLDGADTVRVACVACRDVPVPFSHSMTAIA
jgi:hypothetical protein